MTTGCVFCRIVTRESAVSLWGSLCHHVEWGVSRFIPSMLHKGQIGDDHLVARSEAQGVQGQVQQRNEKTAARIVPRLIA